MILGLIAVLFITSNFYAMEQSLMIACLDTTFNVSDKKAKWLLKESKTIQDHMKHQPSKPFHLAFEKDEIKPLLELHNMCDTELEDALHIRNTNTLCSIISVADTLQLDKVCKRAMERFQLDGTFLGNIIRCDFIVLKELKPIVPMPEFLKKYNNLPEKFKIELCEQLHCREFDDNDSEENQIIYQLTHTKPLNLHKTLVALAIVQKVINYNEVATELKKLILEPN